MKKILILSLSLLLIFSGCQKEKQDLFSDSDILNGDFLETNSGSIFLENEELDLKNEEDFFKGAEFESDENNLGANIIFNGTSGNGNYFKKSTGLDLWQVVGNVDFGSGTVSGGKFDGQNLNLGDNSKLLGIKVAFKNITNSFGIFDSISYGGYGMEKIDVQNDGSVNFSLFFDSEENTKKSRLLKDLFTEEKSFDVQAKIAQSRQSNDGKYSSLRVSTLTTFQSAKNSDGGLLFKWPCLASDFTFIKDDFATNEVFPEFNYEKTFTGFILDKNGEWDENNGIDLLSTGINGITGTGLCAYNDTYKANKLNVVGSQCWEGKTKSDVGRLVFRPKKDSFCVQADSIENEWYHTEYACNILTEKTEGQGEIIQEYLGGDVLYLNGSSVNNPNIDAIFADASEIHYICGEPE
ncbi:hypothetical protein LR002_02415 [Candidatus Gracilibacteria bacterium]|nr:hypothetical protein [Candidatus Gracilibacteria bacterium]